MIITDELINNIFKICKRSFYLSIFIYYDINSGHIKSTKRPWEDIANTNNESIITYDPTKHRYLSDYELKVYLTNGINHFITNRRNKKIDSILDSIS